MSKRSEIFSSLIISRLLFGSETWYIGDKGTKHYLHCSIMRLYKRMLGGSRNDHRSDAEVLHLTGLPDPAVLLRLRRLIIWGICALVIIEPRSPLACTSS